MLFRIVPTMLFFYVLSCLLLQVQYKMHVAALIQIVVSLAGFQWEESVKERDEVLYLLVAR